MMYLYLISQNDRTDYDTYDSAVVVAPSPSAASRMHPGRDHLGPPDSDWVSEAQQNSLEEWKRWSYRYGTWARHPKYVKVRLIGRAAKSITGAQVICSSFNAG